MYDELQCLGGASEPAVHFDQIFKENERVYVSGGINDLFVRLHFERSICTAINFLKMVYPRSLLTVEDGDRPAEESAKTGQTSVRWIGPPSKLENKNFRKFKISVGKCN